MDMSADTSLKLSRQLDDAMISTQCLQHCSASIPTCSSVFSPFASFRTLLSILCPRHYVIAAPLCEAADYGWSIVPVVSSYVFTATHNSRKCLDPWGTIWGMVLLNESIHIYQWKHPIKIKAKNMYFLYFFLICSLPFLHQKKKKMHAIKDKIRILALTSNKHLFRHTKTASTG